MSLSQQENTLLETIANSSEKVFVTAEQGTNLANLGLISVNVASVSPLNPLAFEVSITDAGMQHFESKTEVFDFPIRQDVVIPVKKGKKQKNSDGPRKTRFPFAVLEVGQSFHVSATEDNEEPWRTMSTNVNVAKKKFEVLVEPQEMVTVEVKKAQKNEDGSFVVDAEGKRVFDVSLVQEKKMKLTRNFILRRVDETDPDGVGCRIWRSE